MPAAVLFFFVSVPVVSVVPVAGIFKFFFMLTEHAFYSTYVRFKKFYI